MTNPKILETQQGNLLPHALYHLFLLSQFHNTNPGLQDAKVPPLDTLVLLSAPISFSGWFPLWRQTSFPAICPISNDEYFLTKTAKRKNQVCHISSETHTLCSGAKMHI